MNLEMIGGSPDSLLSYESQTVSSKLIRDIHQNCKAMRKDVIAVGLVLIVLGLPIAAYYASYFLTLNSMISPRFSPEMETRFQLTEALGASLAFLGAVFVVGGLIRTPKRAQD